SLDHTQQLGKTIRKIAAEKAAIVKNSQSKVVIAQQSGEAMSVILGRCRKFGIRPVVISPKDGKNLKVPLSGEHQILNAGCAVAVVELLKKFGFKIEKAAAVRGIKETRWPGRFEVVRRKPDVIVDCAHNTDSAAALVKTFRDSYPGQKACLVLGISADKE